MIDKPEPPPGYRLHRQVRISQGVTIKPPICCSDFASLLVWCPWSLRWLRPKVLRSDLEAWLAVKPWAPEDMDVCPR